MLFKLKKPTNDICVNIITNICKKNGKLFKVDKKIINNCNNNIKNILWNLEYYYHNNEFPDCIILATIKNIFKYIILILILKKLN